MKEKLNLGERFSLLGILPREGNFATLKVVRKLRESLSLTEEEMKEYSVKQIGEQLSWDPAKAEETKEIDFNEFAEEMVKSKLKDLNEKNQLKAEHFTLYEKFVNKEGDKK